MRKDIDKRTENDKEIDEFLTSDLDSHVESTTEVKTTGLEGVVDLPPESTGLHREPELPNTKNENTGIPDDVADRIIEKNKHKAAIANTSPTSTATVKVAKENKLKTGFSNLKTCFNKKKAEISAKLEASKTTKVEAKKEKELNVKNQKVIQTSAKLASALTGNFNFQKPKSFKDLFYKANPNYDPSKGSKIDIDGKEIKNAPLYFSPAKLIRNLIVLFVAIFLIFTLYAFIVVTTSPKIHPEDIYKTVAESSKIYDDQGKEIENVYYNQNRSLVKYQELPKNLTNAFIALEDKTFKKHHGFNWTRMAGAVLGSFFGSDRISGTSTITQQLARNVYLPEIKSQRSLKRKILEMYYADQIEKTISKDKIIEAYLNTIYLGYGNYGVETAAKSYFSKDVKDLNLIECASLAALPQSPDYFSLIKESDGKNISDNTENIITTNPKTYLANDISKNRRNTCLKLMKTQQLISEKDYKDAYDKNLIKFINPTFKDNSNSNTYFTDYLIQSVTKDLIDKYKISHAEAEQMIHTGGLKIYSTMDSTAQNVIAKEFDNSSNFPNITGIITNSDGDIMSPSGELMLYNHSNIFDEDENITLTEDEFSKNKDGSITIKRGHRLNIFTTKSSAGVDYSLEMKHTYVRDQGTIYTYAGGYINIPAKYKSLDENDDLVINKEFFENNKTIYLSDSNLVITKNAYTLPERTIQPQAAMAIVEVGTGQVKALMGGRGAVGQQLFNRAINPRQPGSSIKPLGVYSGALQKSKDYASKGETWPFVNYNTDSQGANFGSYLTAATHIIDQPQRIGGKTWPLNADRTYHKAVSMRTALQQSYNVPAVKIELQLGDEYTANLIKKFGITTLVTEGNTNDLNPAALALGGCTKGVTPLEMAQAYAAFPNGGIRQESISYTKVVDRNGKTVLKSNSKSHKVIDEDVSWIMTDLLKSVVSNGLGSPARLYQVQAGGKTGTTNEEYDIWFDGFTPKYAGAIWIGSDVNLSLGGGSFMDARLWGIIMKQIPNALTGEYKPQPDNVIYYGGEYFTSGTEKGIYRYVKPKEEEEKDKDKKKDSEKSSEESSSDE